MFASKNKKSLKQGEQFKIMKTMFNKNVKNIGRNKYVGLIEGIGGTNNKFDSLKTEFTKTLQNYEGAYRKHLENRLRNNVSISDYLNKTVRYDSELYYITEKGVIKHLENPYMDSYSSKENDIIRGHGCGSLSQVKTISPEIYNLFIFGEPIRAKQSEAGFGDIYWQKCQDDYIKKGSFIRKGGAGGKKAWIDDKGLKYDFASGVTISSLDNSFPKNEYAKTVNAYIWDNFFKSGGENITNTTIKPGGIDNTETALLSINNKLKNLAIEMRTEISEIYKNNDNTESEINKANSTLENIVKMLKKKRKNIKELQYEISGLDGNISDNSNLVKAINLHYVGWGVSLATIVLLTSYILKN